MWKNYNLRVLFVNIFIKLTSRETQLYQFTARSYINCFNGIIFNRLSKREGYAVRLYMYSSSKKKRNTPYLFQYKLSYRNETGANHHGLVSTLI